MGNWHKDLNDGKAAERFVAFQLNMGAEITLRADSNARFTVTDELLDELPITPVRISIGTKMEVLTTVASLALLGIGTHGLEKLFKADKEVPETSGTLQSPDHVQAKYDFLIGDNRVEVKRDIAYHKYGNVYIEFRKRTASGEIVPSGLGVTESDTMAFSFGASTLVVPTSSLKAYVPMYAEKYPAKVKWGGDRKAAGGVCLAVSDLLRSGAKS
jgi:hypothetical protein